MDLAAVPPAVWRAGFQVLRMRILARGAFEEEGRRFRIEGWSRSFATACESASAPAPLPCLIDAEVVVEAGGEPKLVRARIAG
ncbi:MAG: hypothetical protein ACT4PV_11170 [Planctomycetaceae bacterium]